MKQTAQNGSPTAVWQSYAAKHPAWQLQRLDPPPEEEWDRLRDFLDLQKGELDAMLTTVETLFRRGPELVIGNYDYLLAHHETAAILGWDSGADEAHLAERRRFFTVWLARLLGMDLGHDFARYLFRAGQIHAAHGPRRVHVPERYVTGAVSLVHSTFARFLMEEMPGAPQVVTALAGWNKLLTLHLHLMLLGYQSARRWDAGNEVITLALYGRLRAQAGVETRRMALPLGSSVEDVLVRFFNYYPQLRETVFAIGWTEGERIDEQGKPWMTVEPVYVVRKGWRVLRDGRDINFLDGLTTPVGAGQTISFFPPGR
jgi:molybdopterin converting factor small subunit